MTTYLLSIETAAHVSSVALHNQDKLLATSTCYIPLTHHKVIVKMMQDVLTVADIPPAQLHAIAISHGPGSYTGLRIGLSAAKGIAYGLRIPLITVNTLAILTQGARAILPHPAYIGALMDARRERAYAMVQDPQGNIVTPTTILPATRDALPLDTLSGHPLYLVGSGAEQYADRFQDDPRMHVIPNMYPQAAHMGPLAYPKYLAQDWQDLAYITPLYLSDRP